MKNTAILLFVFISCVAYGQNKLASDFNLPKSRLAVQGYDVVSYFNSSSKEGNNSIQSTVAGVHYYFLLRKIIPFSMKTPIGICQNMAVGALMLCLEEMR